MKTPHIKNDPMLLRLRKPVPVALLSCVLGLGVNDALGFGFFKKAFNAVNGPFVTRNFLDEISVAPVAA